MQVAACVASAAPGSGVQRKPLNEVGVAGKRHLRLVFRFHAFDKHELARFVQQRDEARQNRSHVGPMRRVRQHDAIKLHDVRIQLPDALDVRMSRAEIVECDQEAALAELTHGVRETLQIFSALLEHFEHDAPWRQAEALERSE